MSSGTGTRGPEERREGGKSAEFALATDRFLAPLICRVVRAVRVLGAGLGFPVGGTFGFTPPTFDYAAMWSLHIMLPCGSVQKSNRTAT